MARRRATFVAMTPAAVSVAAMIALSVLASGLCVAPPPEAAESLTGIEDAAYPASLGEFFATLDSNGDGQIEQQEAASFISNAIGGADYDTLNEQLAGAKSVLSHLDVDDGAGSDARATVSVAELDQHLHRVLSGVRVWEWVRHGLGLPQYADAFKAHAITPLDFPALQHGGGAVLDQELGVTSQFHKDKVLRAIRLQILGLGSPPGIPQGLGCTCVDGRMCSVSWAPPSDPGTPPLHKYVLERQDSGGQWQLMTEADDGVTLHVDTLPRGLGRGPLAPTYRLSCWNLYGRSAYATPACLVMPLPNGRSANKSLSGVGGGGVGDAHSFGLPLERQPQAATGWLRFLSASQLNSLALLLLPWLLRLLPLSALACLRGACLRLLAACGSTTAVAALAAAAQQQQQQAVAPKAGQGQARVWHPPAPAQVPGAFPLDATQQGLAPPPLLPLDLNPGAEGSNPSAWAAYPPRAGHPAPPPFGLHMRQGSSSAAPSSPPLGAAPGGGGSVPGSAEGLQGYGLGGGRAASSASTPMLMMAGYANLRGLPKSGSEGDLMAGSPDGGGAFWGGSPDGGGAYWRSSCAGAPGVAAGGDRLSGRASAPAEGGGRPASPATAAPWQPPERVQGGKACAFPRCGRPLDILHFRDYQRRHYCGRCQGIFCLEHTAYSPHGPTGSCGHESRCVCTNCIGSFNPEYRAFLAQRNTLHPRPHPQGRASIPGAGGAPAADGAGAGASSSNEPQEAAEQQQGHANSKLLWARAVVKLKAVGRFKKGAHLEPHPE